MFPWLTAVKNIRFAINRAKRVPRAEAKRTAAEYLQRVGMSKAADYYPCQLSGGMKQRVAIARALAMDTDILLLDEPFGALDAKIRASLQELLLSLWTNDGGKKKTVVFAAKQRPTVRAGGSMLVGLALIELLFLAKCFSARKKRNESSSCDIMIFVWLLLIAWELCTSVLNIAHPVLVPCPENVFDTFREQWREMLLNVAYSMELLTIGFVTGMVLAVLLGLIAGWFPRLRGFAYPIANVMAPIPAVVFSPYLVALMPSFRSASALVIILGVFWPTFLTTVNRVESMDPRILDSARMLNLRSSDMIWRVLLPYVIPGIISGLKVSVTTSLLMLNFAELMGAAHGMGRASITASSAASP